MTRITAVFILSALVAMGQGFQPPSWGQGSGQGAGQGSGQGQGQGVGQRARQGQGQGGSLQQQINQLQSQLERLRAQQRQQSRPPVVAQTGPVVGHPVSGTEIRRTTQTLADGTTVNRSDTSYFYRDSAGRMRAQGPTRVEIFDSVGHFSYDVDPATKTYIRDTLSGSVGFVSLAAFGHEDHTHISSDAAKNQQNPGEITEDLGQQKMNGVTAKGSRVTITIPAGALGNNREIKVVNERWYSEDLQVLVKSVNTDPRFGVNEYELTNISESEPAASLFQPPPDYALTSRTNRR